MDNKQLEALEAARGTRWQKSEGRPVVTTVGAASMSAPQRIAALLDPDSAVEYGSISARTPDGDWVAEAGGADFVGTIDGQPVIASSTEYSDKGGGYGAARIQRLYALAIEHRWPVVQFVDGGGSRARHPRTGLGHQELAGPLGRFTLFDGIAELSGWAPTVAIVSGPSFAGHASLAGFSDFLIATRGSAIGMGGPPMVEAALGHRMTPQELAGVEMHERSGGIDLLVDDETAAIAAAKRYLAFRSTGEMRPPAIDGEALAQRVPNKGPYDMHQVLDGVLDQDTFFELRPAFAPELITCLGRIGGHTVGVLANQPQNLNGAITAEAATKAARFVELCDCYEYPLLALIDSPGCDADGGALSRSHVRPIMAHQSRTVPIFSVQVRQAAGMAAPLMRGTGSERGLPMLQVAWPTAVIGERDGFSTLHHADSLDDVILPGETRERVIRLLDCLPPAPVRSEKKHPIDSW